jgi:hypothetical protein
MIAWKTKFLIVFTSQINIEWIKAILINVDLFTRKIIIIFFGSSFGILIAAQTTKVVKVDVLGTYGPSGCPSLPFGRRSPVHIIPWMKNYPWTVKTCPHRRPCLRGWRTHNSVCTNTDLFAWTRSVRTLVRKDGIVHLYWILTLRMLQCLEFMDALVISSASMSIHMTPL